MGKKVLIVLTSVDKFDTTGNPTGWYLPELAIPYKVLVDSGITEFDSVSPRGGKAPMDPGSLESYKNDGACQWFLEHSQAQSLVNNTKTPSQIKASDFAAVLFPGGHGPVFDLANDTAIARIVAEVYENGGVVAAICHGPAGLIPVKLSDGSSIVHGKNVTCFSNSEEEAVNLTKDVPFLLETKLIQLGAKFSKADLFQENVVVDGRLVTGQNPASSTKLGQEIYKLLI